MLFCLGEGGYISNGIGYKQNYMVFNKKVTQQEYVNIKNLLPQIKISLSHWIDQDNMNDKEKQDKPYYKNIGGYFKFISYEEAWANYWKAASTADKNQLLAIPGFDWDIFTGITGIKKDTDNDVKKNQLLKKADELLEKANELKKQAEEL